jgi:hypothetical protein
MKKLLLGSAALALCASVVSVILWRDLRAEREFSAGLQSQLAAAAVSAFRPNALPVTARPPTVADTAGKPEPAGTEAARTAPAVPTFVTNAGLNQREMLKDPEYRKARLAQIRLQLPERYPGLAEELGLSLDQADRLFDLLAESELEMSSSSMLVIGPNGQVDPAQRQEMQRQQQELRAKQDAALNAMLGDARMGKWQEYQQTQVSRQRVIQLGRTLDAMGIPLTAAQRRPLNEAMAAEQARQQQDQLAMVRELRGSVPQGPGSQPDPQTQARLQEENFRRQADSNRRLVDAVSPHLNPRQLDLLRAQLEQQLAMNRASSRLQREAAEQNRSAAPPVMIAAPMPAQAVF